MYSQNSIYNNLVQWYERPWGFYVSPELGMDIHPVPYQRLGFHVAVYYSYATNKTDILTYSEDGRNSMGVRVGVLFLIHTKRFAHKRGDLESILFFSEFPHFFHIFCKITQIIFNSGMAMQNKYNQFFNIFSCFSGLACFSYLSLVLYTDLTPQHQKILISSLGFISVVFIFNLVGFSLIVINRWLQKKALYSLSRRETS